MSNTQASILAAAMVELESVGPAHVSARSIASRAGVSFSLVNHHFGGKTQLLDACILQMYENALERGSVFLVRLLQGESAESVLSDLMLAAMAFARERRGAVRYAMKRLAERGGQAVPFRKGNQDQLLSAFAAPLCAQTGVSEAEMRLRIVMATAQMFRLTVSTDGDMAAILGCKVHEDVMALVDAQLRAITYGLCAPPMLEQTH